MFDVNCFAAACLCFLLFFVFSFSFFFFFFFFIKDFICSFHSQPNPGPVGAALFTIVALQFSGLVFYLKHGPNKETLPAFLNIFFFVFVGSNLIFLIIVSVWGGYAGNARVSHKVAAAVAFTVFDFIINVGFIVITLMKRNEGHGGKKQKIILVVTCVFVENKNKSSNCAIFFF
jgi:hypothetical protein